MSPCGPSKMTLIKKWPKFKNNLKSRSDGTAWAPKARRPTFGPLCIRPTILPFLCSCPFLVSIFAVDLCVLWVLCWPGKATARCYTSICDGIILDINRMIKQISNTNTNTQLRYNHITPRGNFVDKLGTILSSNGQLYLSSLALNTNQTKCSGIT